MALQSSLAEEKMTAIKTKKMVCTYHIVILLKKAKVSFSGKNEASILIIKFHTNFLAKSENLKLLLILQNIIYTVNSNNLILQKI